MEKPLLQVALDNTSLEDAFKTLGGGLDDVVDIVECGTMLIEMEGLRVVDIMRTIYPEKIIVADFKSLAPHFGSQCLKKHPNFTTVISVAEDHVKKAVQDEAKERGEGQEVQIELYGEDWTLEDVKRWKEMGISHIIFARPRSRKGPWGSEDVEDVKKLIDLGMTVTCTGGVTYDDLDILAGLPIYAIICGRSVRNAANPAMEAKRIKDKINELWK